MGAAFVVAALLSAAASASGSPAPPPGRYESQAPGPGFVQLEVDAQHKVTLLYVVTLHLPPAELERHTATLAMNKAGRWCMAPAPVSVAPCLVAGPKGTWRVVFKTPRTVLTLERLPR